MPDLSRRMEQLRLRDLLLLSHIDRLGSLGAVAREMNVTQPAVTQALQGLEEAFGAPLVERGHRGVALKPAGRAALERLQVAMHEVVAAREASHRPEMPVLQLGTSPMAAIAVVPIAIARFRKAMPHTQVHLVESSVPKLWQLLASGELDAVVSRLPAGADGVRLPGGLHHETVGSERLVIVAAALHPLARKRPNAAALAACDWVLPQPPSLAVNLLDRWFAEAGLEPPRVAVTSGSFHSNLGLVAQGGMLTVAPESAVTLHARAFALKVLARPWATSSDIVFAVRAPHAKHPGVQALARCFQQESKLR